MGLGEIGATTYLWLAFWISHVIVLVLQVAFCICFFWLYFLWPNLMKKILNQLHSITTWVVMILNPFWHVRSHGSCCSGRFPHGTIIMANHLCYVDPWVIAKVGLPHGLHFISMGKLFQMPVLGQVMRLSGHFPVWFVKDENGKFRAKNNHELQEGAKELLARGGRICVFPEGSLSYDGKLKPFKYGFFKVAMESGARILPLGMWGNQKLFPPGDQYGTAHPGVVHVAVGDLVDPKSFESAEDLAQHVRNEIVRLRNGLPNYKEDDKYSVPEASL